MKKTTKLLGVVLALALLVGVFTAFGITASAAPATRMIDGKTYYEIGTAQDLLWFANEVNVNDNYTINGILTANIDLSGVCSETLGSWEPIDYFQGIFDGNGFEVTNLYCVGYESGGLFGQVYGGTPVIKNVTVRGYVSGTRYIGGIVGYLYTRTAQVLNCTNYATIESSYDGSNSIYIGGVVGYHSGALIQDSVNYGSVTVRPTESSANGYAGGITGQAITNSAIVNCANYGTISDGDANSNGWEYLGGIVGFTRGPITNCYNEGSVFQYGPKNGQEIGGIAGSAYDSSVVTGCFNNGPVGSDAARPNVGAVVSEIYGTLSNCYWNDTATDALGYAYKGSAATVTDVEGRSAASLADGATAYALGEGWGQQLGSDPVPVLGGMKVYYTIDPASLCTAPAYTYANSEGGHPTHDEQVPPSDYVNGFCIHCGGYQPATDTDGDGYLEIGNAGQLYWYATFINAGNSANVELTAHIVDNENVLDADGNLNVDPATLRQWTPIGTSSTSYGTSVFQGNGYTISGLYAKGYGVGFIGFTKEHAKIYNLGILDSYFENTGYASGAIVGAFHSYGLEMANCFSNATIAGNTYLAGGLVGTANSYPNITNCYYFGKTVGAPIFGTNFSLINTSSKNYYVYGGDDGRADTIQISAQMLVGGELAYLLNDSVSGGTAWGQVLGTDAYPTPVATDANKVYYRPECNGTMVYSNTERPLVHDHSVIDYAYFGDDHRCDVCGAEAVVSVDDKHFMTLDQAIEYAYTVSQSIVTLLSDAQFEEISITRGNFTLDLNGYSITPAEDRGFLVELQEGSLTIRDSVGTGKVLKTAYGHDMIEINGGTLTIWGGSLGTVDFRGSYGNLAIYGGSIENLFCTAPYVRIFGGSFGTISGNGLQPWDFLTDDAFFYDANGALVDARGAHQVMDVTVRFGADLAYAEITVFGNHVYNGGALTPQFEVTVLGKLVDPANYTFSYSNNVGAGNASVSILAVGGTYTGTGSTTFLIEKAIPQSTHFEATLPQVLVYTAEAKDITITSLFDGMGAWDVVIHRDGVLVTEINESGRYSIRLNIEEGDNFLAAQEVQVAEFTVVPLALNGSHIVMYVTEATYNGSAQTPDISVVANGSTLVLGQDYTLSWSQEGFVDAGTYTATIVGIGNYSGTLTKTYTILPKGLVADEMTWSDDGVYSGEKQTPEVLVKDGDKVLASGEHYTITWADDSFVNAGTYTATIAGIGNYSGTHSIRYTIAQATPVVTLTTPSPSLMPGMAIQMRVTVENAQHPSATALPEDFFIYYQIGESGTPVKTAGLIFTLPSDTVLGEMVYVWVENDPAGNPSYAVAKSNVLELLVGQVDYTEEINKLQEDLEGAIADLEAKLNDGKTALSAELAALAQTLADAKAALEATDAANKTELENKISTAEAMLTAAVAAVEQKLEDTKTALNQAILDGDTALDGRITALTQALADAKAALEATDAANKAELEGKIATAEATLTAAVAAVEQKLEDTKTALKQAILDGDTALDGRITALTQALADAKAALEATDAANKAELEAKIYESKAAIEVAVNKIAQNLDTLKDDLLATIAAGETWLNNKIKDLTRALEVAENALVAADAANKAELTEKIDEASELLSAAIAAVEAKLEKAKADLDKAIERGDRDLDGKIAQLNQALADAKSALEATANENKTALTAKMDEAYATLRTAVKTLQSELDALALKNDALEQKTDSLEGFVIVVCILSCLSLAGTGALAVFFFLKKRA